jgi:hypothetical protein
MMETLAAIVIAAVVVPVVLTVIILVPVLICYFLSILSSRRASGAVASGDLAEQRLAFGLADCREERRTRWHVHGPRRPARHDLAESAWPATLTAAG